MTQLSLQHPVFKQTKIKRMLRLALFSTLCSANLSAVAGTSVDVESTTALSISISDSTSNANDSGSVMALSGDGKVAAGSSTTADATAIHATIWQGDNWQNKQDIDLADNSVFSNILALSHDGKVAAGVAQPTDMDSMQAVLWTAADDATAWGKKIALPSLNPFMNFSAAQAVSDDGKVAAGMAMNEDFFTRAVVWRAQDDYQSVSELPILASAPDAVVTSQVYGLNHDGSIAAGESDFDDGMDKFGYRAVLWRFDGDAWLDPIDLGSLRPDSAAGKVYNSSAKAISNDGSIIGGRSNTPRENGDIATHGAIWQINLDDFTVSNSYDLSANDGYDYDSSEVLAVSGAAKAAVGYVENADAVTVHKAVLWSGDDFASVTELGTLYDNAESTSRAEAISDDGTVIAGKSSAHYELEVDGEIYPDRPVLWKIKYTTDEDRDQEIAQLKDTIEQLKANIDNLSTSKQEQETLISELTTTIENLENTVANLESNGQGYQSTITGLNASINALQNDLATLSATSEEDQAKIAELNDTIATLQTTVSTLQNMVDTLQAAEDKRNESPLIVAKIDSENSKKAAQLFAQDTFRLISLQKKNLELLQTGCSLVNDLCIAAYYDAYDALAQDKDTAAVTGLKLGYKFDEAFNFGINVNKSLLATDINESYTNGDNLGMGVYANWQQSSQQQPWFAKVSAAWNGYHSDAKRPLLANTEQGNNQVTFKGEAYQAILGKHFALDATNQLKLFGQLNYSHINRPSYTESAVAFPITYSDISYRDTAIAIGAEASSKLSPKIDFVVKGQVEQSIKLEQPSYQASIPYIGTVSQSMDMNKTRARLQAGINADINDKLSVQLSPYVVRDELKNNTSNSKNNNNWGIYLALVANKF